MCLFFILSDYGGITKLHLYSTNIWKPSLMLSNSAEERSPFPDEATRRVRHDGQSTWFPGAVMTTLCSMDFTNFPFDQQECYMSFRFQEWQREVRCVPQQGGVNFSKYQIDGEWELTQMSLKPTLIADTAFSGFTVFMSLKRRPTFFLVVFLAPIVVLAALSSMVFVLPRSSGERGSYSTTLLLALTLSLAGVTSTLPQRSDKIPLIVQYISAMTALSSLTVVVTMVQIRVSSTTVEANGQTGQGLNKEETDEVADEKPLDDERSRNVIGSKIFCVDFWCFIGYFVIWFGINGYFISTHYGSVAK